MAALALAVVVVAVSAFVCLERWLGFRRWQIERETVSNGDRARLGVLESAVRSMRPEVLDEMRARMASLELKAGFKR